MGNEAKTNRQHQAEKKALKEDQVAMALKVDQVAMADTSGKAEAKGRIAPRAQAKEKDLKLARYFEKGQMFTYPTCTAYKHMRNVSLAMIDDSVNILVCHL